MAFPSKLITYSLTPSANLSSPKLFCPSFRLDLPSYSNSGNEGRVTVPLRKTHIPRPLATIPGREVEPWLSAPIPIKGAAGGGKGSHGRIGLRMWTLCGFGFWVQGFRCFPWMALNFHLINGLGLSPSTLQLVQSAGSLPMVAKPLFGFLSDAVYIGGDHRLPYISLGAFLQALSWATLALIPTNAATFPVQMAFILLSNLGASVTEVVSDALVAEFSKTHRTGELQSYASTALATGALLGNLSGGFLLLKLSKASTMFLIFSTLLAVQLGLSMTTKETPSHRDPSHHLFQNSLKENLGKQFADLMTVISEAQILYPLLWIAASNAVVPLLSGSLFCFQTQCLNLDPSVIGLSKVVGQLTLLCTALLYNHHLKSIPMRTLISGVQIFYALSFISDLLLVKQFNVRVGISNELYVMCTSSLAEAIAQFKTLPFIVLFSRLCPVGCEGSLFALVASTLCLSSIVRSVLGIGLSSFLGVSNENYSSLPFGIGMQALIALLPLAWISHVPVI